MQSEGRKFIGFSRGTSFFALARAESERGENGDLLFDILDASSQGLILLRNSKFLHRFYTLVDRSFSLTFPIN